MFDSERLTTARERRMLSAKGLAERVGVSTVTLSKYENGYRPDDATATLIARALNYPIAFFYRDRRSGSIPAL